jgi:hypothetical protein
MGWEMRRGRRVYYRKVREGGRVRSVYCGSGERGLAAAREDEEKRAKRARERVAEIEREEALVSAALAPPPPTLIEPARDDVALKAAVAPPTPPRVAPFVYPPRPRKARGRNRDLGPAWRSLDRWEEE